MITKANRYSECFDSITLKKRVGGKDADRCGAFREGDRITFKLSLPRSVGASGAVLRLTRDGGSPKDHPFEVSEHGLTEEYSLTLKPRQGLYFYEILILRGLETLFSDTDNNTDISFSQAEGNKFTLLIYGKDYKAPTGFSQGIMYHVFVDRFSRAEGFEIPRRDDAEYEDDWYGGRLQYAGIRGGHVENNRFFGGNLYGVIDRLDYLENLGVSTIYLSPIFEAYSNHKYDTGNYMKVDEGFGGDEALERLIKEAHARGMKIILDGVFNHTGDDSLYFNKKGKYPTVGAYNSKESLYYPWFTFTEREDGTVSYTSWWGIEIMPRLNQHKKECRDFFCAEGGVCDKYMKMGVDGFRLDVADELCDPFLYEFRERLRSVNPEAMLIGEVWENAVTKSSYGERRHYFEGSQLDSVMNYPFRTAVIDAFLYSDAEPLAYTLNMIYATYPREVSHNLMNIIGTHDTDRILSVLGETNGELLTPAEADKFRLTKKMRAIAEKRLMAASAVQYTVYGFPSLYYGDEAGMEGLYDPFCRRPYPWGRENAELLEHYKRLGRIRRHPVFDGGEFKILYSSGGLLVYERANDEGSVTVAVNFTEESLLLPFAVMGRDMYFGGEAVIKELDAYGFCIVESKKD